MTYPPLILADILESCRREGIPMSIPIVCRLVTGEILPSPGIIPITDPAGYHTALAIELECRELELARAWIDILEKKVATG